jgi:hypothetical protein
MNAPNATIWLDLPDGASRAALRAGLMSMGLLPADLPAAGAPRQAALASLEGATPALAFVDLTFDATRPATESTTPPRLPALLREVPQSAARSRVFLTRLAGGYVHDAERRWLRQLGFADLINDLEAPEGPGALAPLLDRAAALLGRPPLDREAAARYLRTMNIVQDPRTPRALIRRRTGLSAEAWAAQLQRALDIRDRSWRLKDYPQCFVGREAVAVIAAAHGVKREQAVPLGQALVDLGLAYHVVHEHPFADEDFFYRLAWSEVLDGIDLALVYRTVTEARRVPVADRSWHGRTFQQCWVGEQAVDALCGALSLSRLQATLAMQRLMQLGLVEHVVRERPFLDGEFFYRHLS